MSTIAEVKLGPGAFEGMLAQPIVLLGEEHSIYETLLKVDALIKEKLASLREDCKKLSKIEITNDTDDTSREIVESKKKQIISAVSNLHGEIAEIWEKGQLLLQQLTLFKDRFDESAVPCGTISNKGSLENTIIEIDRLLKIFKLKHVDQTATTDWNRKNIAELERDFCQ